MLEKPAFRFALVLLIVIGLGRIVASFPSRTTTLDAWLNRLGPETPGYPCAAADFVASNVASPNARVLNDFTWGGFLAWRLGPAYQTFMDGRTQLFPPSFWNSTCLATPAEYRRTLAATPADTAIVPVNIGSLRAAVIAMGWQRVYADDRAAVYVRSSITAKAD